MDDKLTILMDKIVAAGLLELRMYFREFIEIDPATAQVVSKKITSRYGGVSEKGGKIEWKLAVFKLTKQDAAAFMGGGKQELRSAWKEAIKELHQTILKTGTKIIMYQPAVLPYPPGFSTEGIKSFGMLDESASIYLQLVCDPKWFEFVVMYEAQSGA